MGIKIQDIIKDMAQSVNIAYQELKEENVALSLPEIEITLNLEVELGGMTSVETTVISGETVLDSDVKEVMVTRSVMDEKSFKEKGITFNTIATAHTPDKELKNFTLRIAFTPSEKMQ